MHFEILVEDRSGEIALKHLVPKILPKEHTWGIKSYKGIGHLPKDLKPNSDPVKRAFLNQLPRVLQGYGKTYSHRAKDYPVAVIVICDLDDKNREEFLTELKGVLQACHPQPPFARFCLAIEEGEAWLLGDMSAITTAYAQAKLPVLKNYQNDAI